MPGEGGGGGIKIPYKYGSGMFGGEGGGGRVYGGAMVSPSPYNYPPPPPPPAPPPMPKYQPPALPNLNVSAQVDPALTALQGRYNKYLDEFDPATDRGAIRAAQDIRDLHAGTQQERLAGYAARGLQYGSGDASALLENQALGQNARAAERAMLDYRMGREHMKGGALQGALGIMRAPSEFALQEKGLASQNYAMASNIAAQQSQNAFQQYMALLNSQRSSPMYNPPPIYTGGY